VERLARKKGVATNSKLCMLHCRYNVF